jgi:hypothetical protein
MYRLGGSHAQLWRIHRAGLIRLVVVPAKISQGFRSSSRYMVSENALKELLLVGPEGVCFQHNSSRIRRIRDFPHRREKTRLLVRDR